MPTKASMTRVLISLFLLALTAASSLSCTRRGSTSAAARQASVARERVTSAADQALGSAVGITSPCVLRPGEEHLPPGVTAGSRDQSKAGNDIRCSADAECVQKAGTASTGDGVVALACVGRKCRCMLRRLAPPMKRAQRDFELDGMCSGSDVQRLLVDRCMAGLATVQ